MTDKKEYHRQYYLRNRERLLKKQNQYRKEHREEILEKKRLYYTKNKDKISEKRKSLSPEKKEIVLRRQRKRYDKNRQRINAQRRKFYAEHKELFRQRRREYREKNKVKIITRNRMWRIQHRDKANEYNRMRRGKMGDAHQLVNQAIKKGTLVPSVCEVCGRADTQAHHDDYNKPLEVRWLCKKCHTEWHLTHTPKYLGEEE